MSTETPNDETDTPDAETETEPVSTVDTTDTH